MKPETQISFHLNVSRNISFPLALSPSSFVVLSLCCPLSFPHSNSILFKCYSYYSFSTLLLFEFRWNNHLLYTDIVLRQSSLFRLVNSVTIISGALNFITLIVVAVVVGVVNFLAVNKKVNVGDTMISTRRQ